MLEKFNDMNLKDKITVICGVVVLIVIIFVLSTGFDRTLPKPVFEANSEQINTLIDDLGDNYTMNITDTTGSVTKNYIHYYDGRLHLYESENDNFGYLDYNGNRYQMDGLTKELTLFTGSVGYIDNPLYDYELIKTFTDNCDYEYVNENKATCKITLNDYLSYHNTKYNTSYVGNDSEYINISVSYGTRLNSIEIDYSAYNKVVNLAEDNVLVKIKFNYNSNNFNTIYDNYKDVLGE